MFKKNHYLQARLKVQYPIIQAPMAGTDSPEFVAAACNAGVLGSLGAQYRSPEEIGKAIAKIRSLTDNPFAVNLFTLDRRTVPSNEQIDEARKYLHKYYDQFGVSVPSTESVKLSIDPEAQLQTILEARVPVFSFTLGIPETHWIEEFKSKSTLLIGTATNVKEARALEAAGVDAITAQSSEAGGHRGTFIGSYENSMIGALALIPQLADAVNVPIIAAGGIMDGRGIAAAFALGAQGVQLGTAFLTVSESPAHAAYKRAIQEHEADDTVITKVFSGGAARGIKNAFIEANSDKPLLPFPYQNSLTRPIRKIANETGQIEYTNLWSGQGGHLAREMSVNDLVKRLMTETEDVLNKLSALADQYG
jgi:nitronate monooxygenase